MKHISVMLNEAVDALDLNEDSVVVDATLGFGGHSSNILKRIKKGRLYSFDQDSEAIEYSTDFLKKVGTNFTIIKSNFRNMKEELEKVGVHEVDGVLFDLGVSSVQLDEAERGFSYHKDAKLDMRMDRENKFSAYDVVNSYSKEELAYIFKKYGESKFANNIAKKIVLHRENKKIETTLELVDIIKSAVPAKFRVKKHPAKEIFQAIRIEVNHELDALEDALKSATSLLKVGGRVVVITFHSLEDRIVKNYFKELSYVDPRIKGDPNIPESSFPSFKVIKGARPSKEEVDNNRRSRSAKLRIIEKIK